MAKTVNFEKGYLEVVSDIKTTQIPFLAISSIEHNNDTNADLYEVAIKNSNDGITVRVKYKELSDAMLVLYPTLESFKAAFVSFMELYSGSPYENTLEPPLNYSSTEGQSEYTALETQSVLLYSLYVFGDGNTAQYIELYDDNDVLLEKYPITANGQIFISFGDKGQKFLDGLKIASSLDEAKFFFKIRYETL